MLRTRNKLTVKEELSAVFTDYSNEALDYDRDTFTTTIDDTSGYLYISYYKPINIFYFSSDTPNINAGSFTAEYYNGTAFVGLAGFFDETKSFTRSGFIQWDRNQTDEAKTTIDGLEAYHYRLRPSVTHSATIVNGINIVFCDDHDLKREFFEIDKWLPSGETSHILTMVAARDQIIQELRNNGMRKLNNLKYKDLTPFDLLDLPQIKLAATYLTLSKIFSSITDDPDDTYIQKANYYRNLYDGAIRAFYLSVDSNDDGKEQDSESLRNQTGRMVRR